MPELYFDIRFTADDTEIKSIEDRANEIQSKINESLAGDTATKKGAVAATREQAKASKEASAAAREQAKAEKEAAVAAREQSKAGKEAVAAAREQAKAEKELYDEFVRKLTVNETKFRQGTLSKQQAIEQAEVIERQAIETGVLTEETLRGARAQRQLASSQQRLALGFTGMAQSSVVANRALVNLSRIVQDLPFGFLGISNNLDPAANSLKELSATSKETGTTLVKSLLGALKGSGGLIFVLGSLLPTAILLATKGFNMYRKNAKGASEDTRLLTGNIKEFITASGNLRNIDAFSFLNKASIESEIQAMGRVQAIIGRISTAEKELRAIRIGTTADTAVMSATGIAYDNTAKKIESLKDKYGLTEKAIKDFDKELENSTERLKVLYALTQEDPFAVFREGLEQASQSAIDAFLTGIDKTPELIRSRISEIEQAITGLQGGDIDVLKSLGFTGVEDVIPIIKALQKQLEELRGVVPSVFDTFEKESKAYTQSIVDAYEAGVDKTPALIRNRISEIEQTVTGLQNKDINVLKSLGLTDVEDVIPAIKALQEQINILKETVPSVSDPIMEIENRTSQLIEEYQTGLTDTSWFIRNQIASIETSISGLQDMDINMLDNLGLTKDKVIPAIQALQEQLKKLKSVDPINIPVTVENPRELFQKIDAYTFDVKQVAVKLELAGQDDFGKRITDILSTDISNATPTQLADFEIYYQKMIALSTEQEAKLLDIAKDRIYNEQALIKSGIVQAEAARLADAQYQIDLNKLVADNAIEMETLVSDSKIELQKNTISALQSLSQAYANDNKVLAISLLAVEKGLQIAEVVMEGIKRVGQAQALAYVYKAAGLDLLAARAQRQAIKIGALTAANALAIAGQGLGEAANISKSGSRGGGTASGGAGGNEKYGFYGTQQEPIRPVQSNTLELSVSYEDGVDEVIAIKAKNGAKSIRNGTIFVT